MGKISWVKWYSEGCWQWGLSVTAPAFQPCNVGNGLNAQTIFSTSPIFCHPKPCWNYWSSLTSFPTILSLWCYIFYCNFSRPSAGQWNDLLRSLQKSRSPCSKATWPRTAKVSYRFKLFPQVGRQEQRWLLVNFLSALPSQERLFFFPFFFLGRGKY